MVNAEIQRIEFSLTMTTLLLSKAISSGVYTILGNAKDLFDLMDAVLVTQCLLVRGTISISSIWTPVV